MIRSEYSVVQQVAEPIFFQPAATPLASEWAPSFPIIPPKRRRTLPILVVPHTEAPKPYVIITLTGNKLLGPINLDETWKDHFAARGWNSIQEQVDAGYPIYAQPTPQIGIYKEVIDYGAVLNNVIANIDFATAPVFGTVLVSASLRYSLDGLTWSAPVAANSLFIVSFRFLEVTIRFEAVS